MILVTGATGSIGRHVVRRLSARRAPFRALVRDPGRAKLDAPLVVGDFDRPGTITAALAGVDALLLNGSVTENMVEQQRRVFDAASRAGVQHVVRISAAGASAASDRVINQWHGALDAHLEASGMRWTALRPSYFMQNFLSSASAVREGKLFGGFGRGRIAFVDAEDIAACAVARLVMRSNESGAFVLTGPEALSFEDVAGKLAARLGHSVAYVDRPPSEIAAGMRSRGMPEAIAGSFEKMMASFADGRAAEVTRAITEITGRPARSFDDFLEANVGVFRGEEKKS